MSAKELITPKKIFLSVVLATAAGLIGNAFYDLLKITIRFGFEPDRPAPGFIMRIANELTKWLQLNSEQAIEPEKHLAFWCVIVVSTIIAWVATRELANEILADFRVDADGVANGDELSDTLILGLSPMFGANAKAPETLSKDELSALNLQKQLLDDFFKSDVNITVGASPKTAPVVLTNGDGRRFWYEDKSWRSDRKRPGDNEPGGDWTIADLCHPTATLSRGDVTLALKNVSWQQAWRSLQAQLPTEHAKLIHIRLVASNSFKTPNVHHSDMKIFIQAVNTILERSNNPHVKRNIGSLKLAKPVSDGKPYDYYQDDKLEEASKVIRDIINSEQAGAPNRRICIDISSAHRVYAAAAAIATMRDKVIMSYVFREDRNGEFYSTKVYNINFRTREDQPKQPGWFKSLTAWWKRQMS